MGGRRPGALRRARSFLDEENAMDQDDRDFPPSAWEARVKAAYQRMKQGMRPVPWLPRVTNLTGLRRQVRRARAGGGAGPRRPATFHACLGRHARTRHRAQPDRDAGGAASSPRGGGARSRAATEGAGVQPMLDGGLPGSQADARGGRSEQRDRSAGAGDEARTAQAARAAAETEKAQRARRERG